MDSCSLQNNKSWKKMLFTLQLNKKPIQFLCPSTVHSHLFFYVGRVVCSAQLRPIACIKEIVFKTFVRAIDINWPWWIINIKQLKKNKLPIPHFSRVNIYIYFFNSFLKRLSRKSLHFDGNLLKQIPDISEVCNLLFF